jgi:hypothetical protein
MLPAKKKKRIPHLQHPQLRLRLPEKLRFGTDGGLGGSYLERLEIDGAGSAINQSGFAVGRYGGVLDLGEDPAGCIHVDAIKS